MSSRVRLFVPLQVCPSLWSVGFRFMQIDNACDELDSSTGTFVEKQVLIG